MRSAPGAGAGAGGGSSDSINGLLEGGLSWFRHGPKKTQEEIDTERARSISNGSVLPVHACWRAPREQVLTPAAAGAAGKSSWLPSPMLDLSFGTKPPDAPKSDGEIVAQTTADCAVYATPGLVGCIAAADSIVTGKSFAEGLTSPFRHGCVSLSQLLSR